MENQGRGKVRHFSTGRHWVLLGDFSSLCARIKGRAVHLFAAPPPLGKRMCRETLEFRYNGKRKAVDQSREKVRRPCRGLEINRVPSDWKRGGLRNDFLRAGESGVTRYTAYREFIKPTETLCSSDPGKTDLGDAARSCRIDLCGVGFGQNSVIRKTTVYQAGWWSINI